MAGALCLLAMSGPALSVPVAQQSQSASSPSEATASTPSPSTAPILSPVPDGSGTPSPRVATGPADPAVERALAKLNSEGETQTAFTPAPEPTPPPQVPDWLKGFLGWLGGSGKGVVTFLGWTMVVLIVGFALYLTVPWVRDVADSLIGRWRKRGLDDPHGDTIDWQPDVDGARNLLAEADRLAAAGQYGEAVHLLLGRSVEDIGNRRPGLVKPALTARAIAGMPELPGPARTAFGHITATVERSLWARQPIALDAWTSARSAYEQFAFGDHWRGLAKGAAA